MPTPPKTTPNHSNRLAPSNRVCPQVSLSSVVMPMVKMVPRGFTAAADAYLTPHIMRWVGGWGHVPSLIPGTDGVCTLVPFLPCPALPCFRPCPCPAPPPLFNID